MDAAFKVCPQCQLASPLNAAACPHCGHVFTTQFAPPQNPTQAYYPPASGWGQQPIPYAGSHSKVAAGVLGILLGGLGIHAFYIGNNTMGFIMLIGSLIGGFITCGLASAVFGVIGLVQGILYLVATDAEFHQKYVVEQRWF